MARSLGATDCINPKDYDKPIQQVLVAKTQWGIDYTFDATGNTEVMRAALEVEAPLLLASCLPSLAAPWPPRPSVLASHPHLPHPCPRTQVRPPRLGQVVRDWRRRCRPRD